jgi:hypothetical protein
MSTLKQLDKDQFESLFGMSSGYVLEFSDRTFAAFFRETVNVDIDEAKYQQTGTSKAKRLRAFWELESDSIVGKVLTELLEHWSYKNPNPNPDTKLRFDRCRTVVERLLGRPRTQGDSEAQFLGRDLGVISIKSVRIDATLLPILEARFEEATRSIQNGAPLAAIFLCGSILEGLLLGLACADPQKFNQAPNSPKNQAGKVKPFQDWSLAQFIDVSYELGHLKLDVK